MADKNRTNNKSYFYGGVLRPLKKRGDTEKPDE